MNLLERHQDRLVFGLPMKDANFMNKLGIHGLLPGKVKSNLEKLTTPDARSSWFLRNVVQLGLKAGDRRCFISLLNVMKSNKDDAVKDLAEEIEMELAIIMKCKIIIIYVLGYL